MTLISGINVGAPVVPYDSADNQASHKAVYGEGGLRTVVDNTARNAIYANRAEVGMMVYVSDDDKYFKLKSGYTPGSIVDADWQELALGVETYWQRTSTFLHPLNAGDSVAIPSGKLYVGEAVDAAADFSGATAVFNHTDTGYINPINVGAVGAATSGAVEGAGLLGFGAASGIVAAMGVYGQAGVSDGATDTGEAHGVHGVAISGRTNGNNIGVYGFATGSSVADDNYSFYGSGGRLFNNGKVLISHETSVSGFVGVTFDFTHSGLHNQPTAFTVNLTNQTNANASMLGQKINIDPQVSNAGLKADTTGLFIENISAANTGESALKLGGPWKYGIYYYTDESGVTDVLAPQSIYVYQKTYTGGASAKGLNINVVDGSAAGADSLTGLNLILTAKEVGTTIRGIDLNQNGVTPDTAATGMRLLGDWIYGIQFSGDFSTNVITMTTSTPTYAINMGAGTGGGIHILNAVNTNAVNAWGIRVKSSGQTNLSSPSSKSGSIWGENDHEDGVGGYFSNTGIAGTGVALMAVSTNNILFQARNNSNIEAEIGNLGQLGLGGASVLNMGIKMQGDVTVIANYAAGIQMYSNFEDLADNDIFYGLDIAANFSNNSHSGIALYGARIIAGLTQQASLLISDVVTDSTDKYPVISCLQRDSTDTKVGLISGDLDATTNKMYIGAGWGDDVYDSVTDIYFMAAADIGTKDGSAVNVGYMDNTAIVAKKALCLDPLATTITMFVGTTLSSDNSYARVVGSGGAITLTSTPNISAGKYDGHILVVQGTDDSNTVTFRDDNNLVGSTLRLDGGADATLGDGDTLILIWHSFSGGSWYELSRSNN